MPQSRSWRRPHQAAAGTPPRERCSECCKKKSSPRRLTSTTSKAQAAPVGIAQLVNDERGNDHHLMMMGLVMIGALATNASE